MRMSRLAPFVLVGGAVAWAVRERSTLTRRLQELRAGTSPTSAEPLPRPQAASRPEPAAAELPPDGAIIDEVIEHDAEALVGVERELLTVPGEPGETHRRRDQTAGLEAQEIAAAQVRARRNGSDELED